MLWPTPIGNSSKQTTQNKIEKKGYYEARTTPGLWRHKRLPIQFHLIVDDFVVEYVGKQHTDHLATILKKITISQKIGIERSMMVLI